MPTKSQRHAAILRLVRSQRIGSQEQLRESLVDQGFEVTQATLSRDVRDLGLIKVPGARGNRYYALPAEGADPSPILAQLLPSLFVAADGVDNMLVLKTLTGGAQPVAAALDHQQWDDVVGTIAGDDTILVITRSADACRQLRQRLEALALPGGS